MHWATAMSMSFSTLVTIGFMTLIYCTLLYMLVSELVEWFRRWRSARAAERMLDSVPDVPYLPLPPDHQQANSTGGELGGPSSSSTSCVICFEEYARGEGRFVMPGCVHAFHRGCIANWLRQGKNTCPMCRAAAVVVVGTPAGEEKNVAAAVSTAEDMV